MKHFNKHKSIALILGIALAGFSSLHAQEDIPQIKDDLIPAVHFGSEEKPTMVPEAVMHEESIPLLNLGDVLEAEIGLDIEVPRPPERVDILPYDEINRSKKVTPRVTLSGEEVLSIELDRLNAQAPRKIEIPGASLRDVVHFLADSARINYLGLSSTNKSLNTSVTSFMTERPFAALSRLCDVYGIGYQFNSGNWHFYPINANEVIGATYKLKFNNQEKITGSSTSLNDSINNGSNSDSSSSNLSNSNSNNSDSSFSGNGSNGSNGGDGDFEIDTEKLTEEIEKLLSVKTNANNLIYQATGDVDSFEEIPIYSPSTVSMRGEDTEDKKEEGTVIYNSDTSSLFIVATRSQHALIRNYLRQIDKPLPQVYIDTKMIETAVNPTSAAGIDWTGATTATLSLSGLESTVDFNQISDYKFPSSALLSSTDLSIALAAIESDSNATARSQPRLTTVSNRSVSLKSVVNQPIQSGGTTTSAGTSTSTSNLEYIEIGTDINILPRVLGDGDEVSLNVVISVSGISGFTVIDGNETPITSERVFNFEVKVPNGYTLAVGGLENIVLSDNETSVPYISKVPFLGRLFESKTDQTNSSILTLFITPTIIPPESAPDSLAEYPKGRMAVTAQSVQWGNTGTESAEECLMTLEAVSKRLKGYSVSVRELAFNSSMIHEITQLDIIIKQVIGRVREMYPRPLLSWTQEDEKRQKMLAYATRLQARSSEIKELAKKVPNINPVSDFEYRY